MADILLVEDDRTIAMGVGYSLRQEGFSVSTAYTLEQAREKRTAHVDLILLDLGLPDGSGYELCREIRGKSDVPVIILTARDEEVSVVQGLDMGADDYITKPFRLRELISRIRAVLRRRRPPGEEPERLRCGRLTVDTRAMRVTNGRGEIPLTALEYRLLLTLMRHKGQVLTRNRLLESIWDIGGDFVNDNTLTVYIKRLRAKIGDDPQNPAWIQTVRGIGYQMEENDADHG